MMPDSWHTMLIERLRAAQTAQGGWGYAPGRTAHAEPSALAALALSAHAALPEETARCLRWLGETQRPDGAVPISRTMRDPAWPTTLAMLAWLRAGRGQKEWETCTSTAARWLLSVSGESIEEGRKMFAHDSTLVGWSWVSGTHSWVEPTAHAVLALRACGQSSHARTREAVRLLLDRAMPGGGWNYGNTYVMGNLLRPFPAQTGVALAALAGESRSTQVEAAIKYLTAELQAIRAPVSLGWGLIGLSAWNARPDDADVWLAESADRAIRRTPNPQFDALLLLADQPGILAPEGQSHG